MKNTRGFAMLEVLISLLIIMVGVLGLAGLQMMSINNTEVARYESAAALLASNMATQMQANVAYWATAPAKITVAGAVITGGPAGGANCINAVCTPAQMANYDLLDWGGAMAANMPGGNGKIECLSSLPAVCQITLYWTEKNIALTNPTGTEAGNLATGKTGNYEYQTMVTVQ